jgi:hypothetical protein
VEKAEDEVAVAAAEVAEVVKIIILAVVEVVQIQEGSHEVAVVVEVVESNKIVLLLNIVQAKSSNII